MHETAQTIALILFLIAWVIFMVLYAIKLYKRKYGPTRTVRATVIDKTKTEAFSKYQGTGRSTGYVVVFSIDGKKKAFHVSQFSYQGYRIGQSGILEYKGDRLIDFR